MGGRTGLVEGWSLLFSWVVMHVRITVVVVCVSVCWLGRGVVARVIVTSSLPVPYIPNFAMIVECKRTAYQLGRHGGGGRQRDHDLRARAAFMLGGSGVRKERCSGCLGEPSRNVVTYGLRHGRSDATGTVRLGNFNHWPPFPPAHHRLPGLATLLPPRIRSLSLSRHPCPPIPRAPRSPPVSPAS